MKTTTFEASIPAIRAALVSAPKNDIRPYLIGVHFEPDGDDVMIVSSDDKMLFAYRDKVRLAGASFEPFIAARELLETALKAAGKKDETIRITVEPQEGARPLLTVSCGNGARFQANAVDGRYPDWRRVLSNAYNDAEKPGAPVCSTYSADYIARLGKITQELGGEATIQHCGEHVPDIVHFGNGVPAVCLITRFRVVTPITEIPRVIR